MKLKKLTLFGGIVAILFFSTIIAHSYPKWHLLYTNATISCDKDRWIGIGWKGFGIGGNVDTCSAGIVYDDGSMSNTVILNAKASETALDYYGCQSQARARKKVMTLEGDIYKRNRYGPWRVVGYKAQAPRYCVVEED